MALTLLERLEARFRLLEENGPDLSWKSPEALHKEMNAFKPGVAYHALMATAGPCSGRAVWTRDWPSRQYDKELYQACIDATNGYVYKGGTPAPEWTQQDVHMAMAPQIRAWANIEARNSGGKGHGARSDPNAIDDLAMNMHAELQKMLAREKDEGRILGGEKGNGFVSFVTKTVSMAGAKGIGGTDELRVARGRASQMFDPDFKGYVKTPEQARAIANRVQPPYTHTSTPKLDPGNPYDRFSPQVYQVANQLADALEARDQQAVSAAREAAKDLRSEIEDAEIYIQGTHTGKRLISTPSGAKKGSQADQERQNFIRNTKISSMSGARKEDGGDIDIMDTSSLRHLSELDPDTIYQVLRMGRITRPEDLKHPKLAGKGLSPLTDFDLRYLIRNLSHWLPDGKYPGKGVPGKDVEAPDGTPSPWTQAGQPQLWDKKEILASIAQGGSSGGGDQDTSSGGGIDNLLAPIPPGTQKSVMQLLAQAVASGQKVNQAEIAKRVPNSNGTLGISKVMIGKHITAGLARLGMTKDQFFDAIMSGGASIKAGGDSTPDAGADVGGVDPLTKFSAWMKQYMEEMSLDESCDDIDYDIVWRCGRAITELHHHLVIKPMLRMYNS